MVEGPIKGLSGLTVSSMRKHYAIIPLFAMLGVAVTLAGGACLRTATKNPDVTFSRKNNPEPWDAYRAKQYKFFGIGRDYTGVHSEAPEYK